MTERTVTRRVTLDCPRKVVDLLHHLQVLLDDLRGVSLPVILGADEKAVRPLSP